MKKALITGVTGQDGSYLSEFLIEKGYEFMASSVVLPLTTVNALPIWRATRISTCITAIWAIR